MLKTVITNVQNVWRFTLAYFHSHGDATGVFSQCIPGNIVSGAKFAAKCPFSPNSTVTKPSKSSSESELSVHCCRAAVKTRRNSKECRPKLDENEIILPDIPL